MDARNKDRPARPRRLRHASLAAALLLALVGVPWSQAHDWSSPVPREQRVAQAAQEQPSHWTLAWGGPQDGRPAAPSAQHCDRPPQTLELRHPDDALAAQRERRDEDLRRRADRPASSRDAFGRLAEADAVSSAKSMADAPSGVAAAPATRHGSPPSQPQPQSQPAPRPRDEAVSAGVVDDNADFGSYLAYRARNTHLPVRARDVQERYGLTVHDASGRPVPDAQVSVHAGGQALALWARTDSGGKAWLHPRVLRADLPDVLEVQASSGAASGRALLRRGQRDALQITLNAVAPRERTRLDLVFLVDATGSMADEIDKLKRSMRAMAEQIARLPSRPDLCFALVAYRDRGDAFFVRAHDFSNDLGAFQRQLGALQAAGGGDYPEALNEALHTAVHRLSWRGEGATRLVVLLADAPPHLDYGAPWYDDDMQGALARGIKLFAVGASGLDATGEYVFRQAAQYTGGRFVFLTYARAGDPSSGPGRETAHEVGGYSVESLDKLVLRLVREELAQRSG